MAVLAAKKQMSLRRDPFAVSVQTGDNVEATWRAIAAAVLCAGFGAGYWFVDRTSADALADAPISLLAGASIGFEARNLPARRLGCRQKVARAATVIQQFAPARGQPVQGLFQQAGSNQPAQRGGQHTARQQGKTHQPVQRRARPKHAGHGGNRLGEQHRAQHHTDVAGVEQAGSRRHRRSGRHQYVAVRRQRAIQSGVTKVAGGGHGMAGLQLAGKSAQIKSRVLHRPGHAA